MLTTNWKTLGDKNIGSYNGDIVIYIQARYLYQDISNGTTGVQYRAVLKYFGNGTIRDRNATVSCIGSNLNRITTNATDTYRGGEQYVLYTSGVITIAHDSSGHGFALISCNATLNFPSFGLSGTASGNDELPVLDPNTKMITVRIQSISTSSFSFRATSNASCSEWYYLIDNVLVQVPQTGQSITVTANIPSGTHTLVVRGKYLQSGGQSAIIVSDTRTFSNTEPTVTITQVSKTKNSFTVRVNSNITCDSFSSGGQTIIGSATSKMFTFEGLSVYTNYTRTGAARNSSTDVSNGSNPLTGRSSTLTVRTKGSAGKLKISDWKDVVPYVKINGAWKEATAYTKVDSNWRKMI